MRSEEKNQSPDPFGLKMGNQLNSTQPSLDMLIKIAKVLEVELTDLVRIQKDE